MAENFVAIFFWRGNFWREFLAEVFGGFWDFWRLGIFGGFGGLVVFRVESVLSHRCWNFDVETLTFEAVLVVWFGIGFGLGMQALNGQLTHSMT